MRNTIILIMFATILYACEPSKSASTSKLEAVDQEAIDTIKIENKELEYEIMILEIGFENWLVTQRPIEYYTQAMLENRNMFLVSEWNRRVNMPNVYDPLLYNQPIDYQQRIDYGKEVNYMLYMYFQFFEKKYKQRL